MFLRGKNQSLEGAAWGNEGDGYLRRYIRIKKADSFEGSEFIRKLYDNSSYLSEYNLVLLVRNRLNLKGLSVFSGYG